MNPEEARLQAAIAAEEWPTAAFAAGELFARSGQTDPRWAYAAALAEERQGKGAAALAWMARACTAGPDFPPAWDGRVRLALAAGDAADALAAQDHAMGLRPATPTDRLLRGRLALAAGRPAEALKDLAALSADDPAARPAIAKAICGQPRGVIPWRLTDVLATEDQSSGSSTSGPGSPGPTR
ncbi:MAG: hypothetical protein KDA49_10665 [Rhodospirillaceae bacterium]|nr:hypothetical protein [Rhodospirillaceae bacterium]